MRVLAINTPGLGASCASVAAKKKKKAIYRRGADLLHVYLCGAQPRRKLTATNSRMAVLADAPARNPILRC